MLLDPVKLPVIELLLVLLSDVPREEEASTPRPPLVVAFTPVLLLLLLFDVCAYKPAVLKLNPQVTSRIEINLYFMNCSLSGRKLMINKWITIIGVQ